MKIIVTGGLGYIGSNIVTKLLKRGNEVLVIDNLKNSNISVVKKILLLSNKSFKFKKVDCKDKKKIFKVFQKFKPNLVIHLAGLKSVSESIQKPKKYLSENVKSAKTILDAMQKFNVKKLIFSSSATVYGKPIYLPIDEKHPTKPINPYGKSKLIIEKNLIKLCKKINDLSVISLRYFNPVGSDHSGLLVDNPLKPNNLFPKIYQLLNKKINFLPIFGNNYDTSDGTTIRDYIHILDLSEAHIKSIKYLRKNKGYQVFNVGTGKGYSIKQVIRQFELENKKILKLKFMTRRRGDLPKLYAKVKKIENFIGWKSRLGISKMCRII